MTGFLDARLLWASLRIAYKGNAYGLANRLSLTAFLKPKLRAKRVENLFFAERSQCPGRECLRPSFPKNPPRARFSNTLAKAVPCP